MWDKGHTTAEKCFEVMISPAFWLENGMKKPLQASMQGTEVWGQWKFKQDHLLGCGLAMVMGFVFEV